MLTKEAWEEAQREYFPDCMWKLDAYARFLGRPELGQCVKCKASAMTLDCIIYTKALDNQYIYHVYRCASCRWATNGS